LLIADFCLLKLTVLDETVGAGADLGHPERGRTWATRSETMRFLIDDF
jgi:hypothetical protein